MAEVGQDRDGAGDVGTLLSSYSKVRPDAWVAAGSALHTRVHRAHDAGRTRSPFNGNTSSMCEPRGQGCLRTEAGRAIRASAARREFQQMWNLASRKAKRINSFSVRPRAPACNGAPGAPAAWPTATRHHHTMLASFVLGTRRRHHRCCVRNCIHGDRARGLPAHKLR